MLRLFKTIYCVAAVFFESAQCSRALSKPVPCSLGAGAGQSASKTVRCPAAGDLGALFFWCLKSIALDAISCKHKVA